MNSLKKLTKIKITLGFEAFSVLRKDKKKYTINL